MYVQISHVVSSIYIVGIPHFPMYDTHPTITLYLRLLCLGHTKEPGPFVALCNILVFMVKDC